MGDISDDEKRQIVHQLLMQTPPGEFNNTFNDVRLLVDNDGIMKQCGKTYMDYWLEQQVPVSVGDTNTDKGERVALCREARQSDGSFLAPGTKKLFTFDPMRQESSVVGDFTGTSEHENYRQAVADKLREYVNNHYPDGVETVLARTNPETNLPEIVIVIESHSFQQQNFYTANWRELWTVSIDQSGSSAAMKGVVKVQVHYYEDGNVQKVSKKDLESSLKFTSEQNLAEEVVKCLEQSTNGYQRSIVDTYEKFQSNTFKSLRRQLPVTHSKINWEQIASYKIGDELKNQSD